MLCSGLSFIKKEKFAVLYATFDSLSALTVTFIAETGAPGSAGVANALTKKLEIAKAEALEGRGAEARSHLQAYINQVSSLSGNKLTEEQASTLVRWDEWLHDTTLLASGIPTVN